MTELDALPYSGQYAAVGTNLFNYYRENYSNTSPLVFRIKNTHVPAYAESSIPPKTIALPLDVAERLEIDDDSETAVLLTKKGAVTSFLSGEFA